MKKKYTQHGTLSLLFFIGAFFAILPAYAQQAGDIEIKEIKIATQDEGQWIEIQNTSKNTIDITTLKVKVGSAAAQAITIHAPTQSSIRAEEVIVIAKEPAKVKSKYPSIEGSLYESNISLTNIGSDSQTITIVNASDETIADISYIPDVRVNQRGTSFHIGLDGQLHIAPATPGEIAVNPITQYIVLRSDEVGVSTMVRAKSATELNSAGTKLFLKEGDIISLLLSSVEETLTVTSPKILIGTREVVPTQTKKTDILIEYAYTIDSADTAENTSAEITYALDVNGETKEGNIIHEGKRAYIDKKKPTLVPLTAESENVVRKEFRFSIDDDNAPETIEYSISDSQCLDKAQYDASGGSKQESAVENNAFTIVITGTENNGKYICIKGSDLAGNTLYYSSNPIADIKEQTLYISEIAYSTSSAANGAEWIEITNAGTSEVDLTTYIILDKTADRLDPRTIRHESGNTTLLPGGIAVIVKSGSTSINRFKRDYPHYAAPLFIATSLSLGDTEDVVGIQNPEGETIDIVRYKDDFGADGNGKTLHIDSEGTITEGYATPGDETVETTTISGGSQQEEKSIDRDIPFIRVIQFDGNDVTNGQNLFFTKKESVVVTFHISKEGETYNVSNFETATQFNHQTNEDEEEITVSNANIENSNGGAVTVSYTIDFFKSTNAATDGTAKIALSMTGKDSATNITVHRNNEPPTIEKATTAGVLGFYATNANNAIVPFNVGNIKVGDWVQTQYNDVCGDGLTSFIVRNGGHGISYNLNLNRYKGCTIAVTDTAGNTSATETLPDIIVGR